MKPCIFTTRYIGKEARRRLKLDYRNGCYTPRKGSPLLPVLALLDAVTPAAGAAVAEFRAIPGVGIKMTRVNGYDEQEHAYHIKYKVFGELLRGLPMDS